MFHIVEAGARHHDDDEDGWQERIDNGVENPPLHSDAHAEQGHSVLQIWDCNIFERNLPVCQGHSPNKQRTPGAH